MTILMTHVGQYTGPGTIPVLLSQYREVACHDASFADPDIARQYENANLGTIALHAQNPETLFQELRERQITVDKIIHNDVYPNTPLPIEDIPLEIVEASFAALLLFPMRLTQLLLPALKAAGHGQFVFVTSARYLQPEPGFAVATSIRAGTTAFALALAREAAPHGIQVNVVAPNYLYSEAYYPMARFIDDPVGRAQIAAKVPLGRLGEPKEIGELIAFLVSGRSSFVTGQVIDFTGGWP
ncbi:MAG: halohydrin epoxidase [Proteobacteria bacterium]|nr:halohydrin epoxidase [Pseudomonadota bacterium]